MTQYFVCMPTKPRKVSTLPRNENRRNYQSGIMLLAISQLVVKFKLYSAER